MMTKKLFFGMMIALMAVVATSCKKATYLKADKASLTFAIKGGTETVHLSSDVTGFSVEEAPEWVEASIVDSTLTVTVAENTTGAKREGKIVVSVRGQEAAIPVVQNVVATHLSVSEESVTIPKEGGSQDVDVDCDGDVQVDAPGFVTASYANGKLSVSASANDGGSKNGTIKLTADSFSAEVKVKLEGNICQRCKGTGKITCPECHGIGEVCYRKDAFGDCSWFDGCPKCGGKLVSRGGGAYGSDLHASGSGKIKCPDCGGTGH